MFSGSGLDERFGDDVLGVKDCDDGLLRMSASLWPMSVLFGIGEGALDNLAGAASSV